jgi:hypothetical protein
MKFRVTTCWNSLDMFSDGTKLHKPAACLHVASSIIYFNGSVFTDRLCLKFFTDGLAMDRV